MTDLPENADFRCPTCGARQSPAAECRRCKCDLRLYQAALQERRRWKLLALRRIGAGQYPEAAEAARRYWAASPDEDAARLLAVANLLAGRYHAALAAYRSVPSTPET